MVCVDYLILLYGVGFFIGGENLLDWEYFGWFVELNLCYEFGLFFEYLVWLIYDMVFYNDFFLVFYD